MNRDKELFKLARNYVMITELFVKARIEDKKFEEEIDKIEKIVLENGYDIDKFVEYKKMCRGMSVTKYNEFLKTLD